MKKAYPNFSENMPVQQVYNISNWMNSMKDIYIKLHLGANKNEAVELVTQKWDPNEKREFLNWLKYYESGDHTKYKRAQQSYYVNDDINYFLPNPKAVVPNPIRNMNEQINSIPQEAEQIAVQKQNELSKEDKRKLIEDHRRKILGRLNSAEKLLSSHHGQMFAGTDFEKLLSAIYELKKQIQTVNKMSLSAQTIVDLIVRQARILNTQGHLNASAFMVKFAQNVPGDFSMNLGDVPAGGSQPQGAGSLGNMPPDLTQSIPAPDTGNAIDKFIENLEGFGITEEDEDNNEAKDNVEINDDVILDQEIVPEHKDDLFVSAQAIQPSKPMPVATQKMPKQKPAEPKDLEVMSPPRKDITTEEVGRGPDISAVKNDFDALIDSAFSNLKIADVVNKLEAINNIFRNREISRQLAIADVMLDRLGLATYFPELSEATNKILESNNYCLTRLENILSRLRGTMNDDKIDLEGNEEQQLSPEANGIKSSLEQEEAKEKQRKEVKKQVQNKTDLEKLNKPEGEVENVQEELAQPTQIEKPQPKQQLRQNV